MSGIILIAVPDRENAKTLGASLGAARYHTMIAEDENEILEALRSHSIRLVLIDEDFAGAEKSAMITRIRRISVGTALTLIVLTNPGSPSSSVSALRSGADDVLPRTVDHALLLARLRSVQRSADTSAALEQRQETIRDLGLAEPALQFETPATVALVSHDPERAEDLKRDVAAHLNHNLLARGIADALLDDAAQTAPDAFVVEAALAHPGEALRLITDLRSRAETRHSSIIVIHDRNDIQTATMALDLGASDLATAEASAEEIAIRLERQIEAKRANERLRKSVDEGLRLAVRDPLTGLFNRRYAMAHIDRVTSGPPRRGYCVILVDIDRLKSINDSFGHRIADRVLIAVARLLADNVRDMDMVARIGGDEFLVFLPDPDPSAALIAAERLCGNIRKTPIDVGESQPPISVTASLGVALARPGGALELAIDNADRALYTAKEAGRDTVSMSPASAA